MSALWYLSCKQVKNFVRTTVAHPGKLALYLLLIAAIGISLFSRFFAEPMQTETVLNLAFLHGIYFVAMLLIAMPILLRGLKSGATFFRMSDVHFLFTAPISSKAVLFYGLAKQLLASLFITLILLGQASTLTNLFRLEIWQIVVMMLGVAIMLCCMQILAMMIYSLTNGKKQYIHMVTGAIFVCVAALVAVYIAVFLADGGTADSAVTALASPYLEFIPLVGWLKGAVFGFLLENYIAAGIYTALFAAAIAIAVVIFAAKDLDFYEDVLQSTARADRIRQKKREGKFAFDSGKLRVTSTGIKKGWGPNVLFYKHLLEGRRRSRFFISIPGVILLLAAVAFAVIFQIAAKEQVSANFILLFVTIGCCYTQFFFSLGGDWCAELDKTAIYLIPASPFQKLLWASMTTVLRPFAEGALIFAVVCAVLRANPLYALLSAITYGTAGLLYIACNILFHRLFGKTNVNRGPVMFLYMLCVLLVGLPGIVCSGCMLAFVRDVPAFVVPLPFIAWGLGVFILIIALCRNILDNVEYHQ